MRRLIPLAAAYTLVQGMSALAILDRLLYGEWDGKGGDKLTQLMNVLSIGTSLLLLYAGRHRLGLMRRAHYLPFVLVALFLLSAGWSMDPSGTIRRTVNYAVLVVGAMGMAHALRPIRIMKITVWVCTIAAILSLALAATPFGLLFNPETGESDFRGVFGLKNMLGEGMVAGVLAALYCFMAEPESRKKYVLRVLLFIFVIIAAKSATSLLVSLSYIGLLSTMALYGRGGGARVLSFCLLGTAMLLGAVIAVAPDLAFEALGKDPTLTGRTDLWPYVIDPIETKLLLGWGFNGFWLFSNPAAMQISGALGWFVPEAHNGLLEFLLQLGIVGTILFLVLLVRYFQISIKCIRYADVPLGRTMLVFLFGLLVMSVSEAVLLTPSQIPTLQFFLYGFMCEAALLTAARDRAGMDNDQQAALMPVAGPSLAT